MTRQIVITEAEDAEYVTSALSVYIDHLTEKFGDAEPQYMMGPWLEVNDPLCTHEQTIEAPPEALDVLFKDKPEMRPEKALLCMNDKCLARAHIVDANDAVRGTVKGAIELRQRLVKEWGYDPTHES